MLIFVSLRIPRIHGGPNKQEVITLTQNGRCVFLLNELFVFCGCFAANHIVFGHVVGFQVHVAHERLKKLLLVGGPPVIGGFTGGKFLSAGTLFELRHREQKISSRTTRICSRPNLGRELSHIYQDYE